MGKGEERERERGGEEREGERWGGGEERWVRRERGGEERHHMTTTVPCSGVSIYIYLVQVQYASKKTSHKRSVQRDPVLGKREMNGM